MRSFPNQVLKGPRSVLRVPDLKTGCRTAACANQQVSPRLLSRASSAMLACGEERRLGERGFSSRPKKTETMYEILPADQDLFKSMFAPFGVSEGQFGYLMAHGSKVRGGPGTAIIKGGEMNPNIVLLVRGWATATARKKQGQIPKGAVICKYVGKLSESEERDILTSLSADVPDFADEMDGHESQPGVPSRGSLIGGSSLADEAVASDLYPNDVVATSQVEWIEWDRQELSDILDAQRWRAVQAAFFATLYIELIQTLTNQQVHDGKFGSLSQVRPLDLQTERKQEKVITAPSPKQLMQLSCFVAVPFFGFGFADNFVMILCGDFIDAQFGVRFGLSTLAAAGLGNWMSDVVGLSLGDAIERGASRMGLSNGGLTKRQESLQIAKWVSLFSRIIGISLGCIAGMVPLLFLSQHKVEFANEDLEIFDTIFAPSGVSTSAFVDLMEHGEKKRASAGHVLVQGGELNAKVFLMLRGIVSARHHISGNDDPASYLYAGRLEERVHIMQELSVRPGLYHRGSIVGGSAIHNTSKLSTPYPNDVVANGDIEWLEWDIDQLCAIMEKEKAIQASIYSILYGEILETLVDRQSKNRMHEYQQVLAACLADGKVHENQRRLLEDCRSRLGISDTDHAEQLSKLGWSHEAWERGVLEQSSAYTGDSVTQLEKAMGIMSEVVLSLKHQTE